MADLIPRGPLDGHDPVTAAGCTLEALALGPVASIQPFPGRTGAVDAALRARGLGFPAPGGSLEVADTRIVWAGRDTAFLIGTPAPDLAEAAVIDLTDGWVGMTLAGAHGCEVLARLVPMDLRPAVFAEGAAARTLLNHVPLLILRRGRDFELMVPASLADTAWHEVATAMAGLAAREG